MMPFHNNVAKPRSQQIDLLKGIAIIAVILYHSGICTYGYLGVDVFLVIAGYLTTKSILKLFQTESFGYAPFLKSRIIRLWPLLLVISIVSLFLGFLWMLPMPLKNTAETAAASSAFLNNYVQYITSSDYWDTSNDYKPLMHTWYVALLFHFYIIYPLILLGGRKIREGKGCVYLIGGTFVISLGLYLMPQLSIAQKFYLLPARLFEFAIGGLLVIRENNLWRFEKNGVSLIALGLITILIYTNFNIDGSQLKLLSTVFLTCVFIIYSHNGVLSILFGGNNQLVKIVSFVGKASYSFYLWHQVILAFYRYVINDQFQMADYIMLLVLFVIISCTSYYLIEDKMVRMLATMRRQNGEMLFCTLLAIVISLVGIHLYRQNGLVRDIPELDLYLENANNVESQDYNERNKVYEKSFPDNGMQNILVVGDSFARDWINVLREAGLDSFMNISYHQGTDDELSRRIDKADWIFVANNASFDVYYPYMKQMMQKKFYRVGTKSFTMRNGIVYNNRRYSADYYHQSFTLGRKKQELNEKEKLLFGECYIDMMEPIMLPDGTYPYFTPSKKLYSHDGIHLTKAGAQEYAKRLDIIKLIKN